MTARGPFECRVDGVVHLPASGLPKPAGQIHAAWLRQIRHQPDQYLIGQGRAASRAARDASMGDGSASIVTIRSSAQEPLADISANNRS